MSPLEIISMIGAFLLYALVTAGMYILIELAYLGVVLLVYFFWLGIVKLFKKICCGRRPTDPEAPEILERPQDLYRKGAKSAAPPITRAAPPTYDQSCTPKKNQDIQAPNAYSEDSKHCSQTSAPLLKVPPAFATVPAPATDVPPAQAKLLGSNEVFSDVDIDPVAENPIETIGFTEDKAEATTAPDFVINIMCPGTLSVSVSPFPVSH